MAPADVSRRDLILETALEMFSERGFDGTSVSDIADSLGVSKSAISYHFPRKEDMIDALADPYLSQVEELLDTSEPGMSDGELEELLGAYLELLAANRDIAVWVDTDQAVSRHDPISSRSADALRRLSARFTGPHPTGDQEARALAAIGGLLRPVRELDADALLEHRQQIVSAAVASYTSAEF
jgi:AcrR family transcriptional regulator